MSLKEVVALFPGQGSQRVQMGADLFENFKVFRETCEEASDTLGFDMAQLCFEDPNNQLNLTEFTQPALLTMGIATIRTLAQLIPFDTVISAGHSLGEYTALVHEGVFTFANGLKAVHFRGQAMQGATPFGLGTMAAYIGTQSARVEGLCKEMSEYPHRVIEVVNDNSPSQLVVSGHTQAVQDFCQYINENKLGRAVPLSVSAPFHSSLMAPAAEMMAKWLDNISLQPVKNGIVANIDAKRYQGEEYQKKYLIQQLAGAVKWTQTLHTIQNYCSELGKEPLWVEFGPGTVLSGLAKKTAGIPSIKSSMPLLELKNIVNQLN